MGRRTVLLIVAVLVAALGTGMVFAYVNRADERAKEDQELVEVLVAKTLIRAGTLGSTAERELAFETRELPRSAAQEGYLTDPRPIADLVAVADIFPGDQIIPGRFAASGSTAVLQIPANKLAMSVQLGDPQRVAGFVRPGSEVAIMVTINARTSRGGPREEFTRVLLPRVTVIAVGPTTLRPPAAGQGNTEPLPTAILTLALDQVQAQKLTYAVEKGKLYFALLTKESKIGAGGPVNDLNLFS